VLRDASDFAAFYGLGHRKMLLRTGVNEVMSIAKPIRSLENCKGTNAMILERMINVKLIT